MTIFFYQFAVKAGAALALPYGPRRAGLNRLPKK